jgi:hypothetical protein
MPWRVLALPTCPAGKRAALRALGPGVELESDVATAGGSR